MNQQTPPPNSRPPLSFWKAIVLIIALIFVVVILFAVFIYIFINGADQLGLSTTGQIAIFVVITGIFAWLIKRISDVFTGMSRHWFPEETDEPD